MKVDRYIIAEGKFPQWLNEEAARGRVKINYDDGEVVNVMVYTPTGVIAGKPGDALLRTKSGMSIVPAEKAIKYGVKNEKAIQKSKADI